MSNTENSHTNVSITKGRINDASYKVSNVLGNVFNAEVYRNALAHELQKMGSTTAQSTQSDVFYDGVIVGQYPVDLVVDDHVVVIVQTEETKSDYSTYMFRHLLLTLGHKLGAVVDFSGSRPEVQFVTGKS